MSDVSESRWFKVSILIFSAAAVVVFGFNVYMYAKLNNNPIGSPVTPGEIKFLLISNIILLIVSIILLFYSLWKLSFSKRSREYIVRRTGEELTTEKGGFSITDDTPITRNVRATPARTPKINVRLPTAKNTLLSYE